MAECGKTWYYADPDNNYELTEGGECDTELHPWNTCADCGYCNSHCDCDEDDDHETQEEMMKGSG